MENLAGSLKAMRNGNNIDILITGGILLTMYDHTLELTGEVDREVRDFFGEIVFQTVIPRDVAVSEAPSHGKSVIDYAPRARGTRPTAGPQRPAAAKVPSSVWCFRNPPQTEFRPERVPDPCCPDPCYTPFTHPFYTFYTFVPTRGKWIPFSGKLSISESPPPPI